ncbi:MAG: hypothetical protein Q7I99_04105 [Acholeplasmataceae bacterium]|nr:hypothetical protein [Acholeplasmataceae bacterium]
MGGDVLVIASTVGLFSAYGGYASWDNQQRGLNHSWTTERRDYWQSRERANGKSPNGEILHHPHGRHGANVRIYYPVSLAEHRAIHDQLGYGNRQGGFYQYREWLNFWRELFTGF